MAGELSIEREIVAAVVLTVQIGSVVGVGAVVGRWIGGRDNLLAVLVGAMAAIAQAVAVPLVLGVAGILSLPTVLALHVVSCVVAIVLVRRAKDRVSGYVPVRAASSGSARTDIVVLASIGAIVAYVALALMLSFGAPPNDTDSREYHVTNFATWLRNGEIWDLPYQSPAGVTATHPGDAEMFALWLALPTHGDELSYLAPTAFAVLAVLGAALLARELSGREGADRSRPAALGALAATVVLIAPIYVSTQIASLSNDVTVAACTVSALALIVVSRRTPNPLVVAAAGVAIGLDLGSKYTALVPAGLLVIGAIWLVPRRRDWWWIVPGVVVLALPWYLRNLFATGNPLFPQALGPLSGGSTPLHAIDAPVLDHLLHGRGKILDQWVRFGARRVGPVLIIGALGMALCLRSGSRRVERIAAAALAGAAFVGYLATPYSGGGPTGLVSLLFSNLRYSMPAVLLAAVCWSAVAPSRVATWSIGAVGAWSLWYLRTDMPIVRPDVGFTNHRLAVALLAGLVAAAAVAFVARASAVRSLLARNRSALAAAALAVVMVAAAVGYHHNDRGRQTTALERALLTYGTKQPVAVLGVYDLRSLLGPRLERTLVLVSRGGQAGEVSFADENQVLRLLTGDTSKPSAPASFGPALDAALIRSGAQLLVVGQLGQSVYPEGWTPDHDWCPVAAVGSITLYTSGQLRAQSPNANCRQA